MAKYLRLENGDLYETNTTDVSAGAADADRIPSLNADGVLDPTILNAGTTGADKVLMTDAAGRLDLAVLPVGVGLDVATITASEPLAAGNMVNLHIVGGAWRARRADASAGRPANGFVLEGSDTDDAVRVYFEGSNTQVAGLTGIDVYLATTPGGVTSTPPTGAGNLSQKVGWAYGPTSFYFQFNRPVYLA